MSKQAYIKVAEHDDRGPVIYFEDLTALAMETQTKPEEWRSHEGWVDIDLVRGMRMGLEALLAGRLKLRDKP